MDTVVMGFAIVWCALCGRSSLRAFGAISVEVIMKKISSRNTISVIPDILKPAWILFLERNDIFGNYLF
jgi:hypothetical protein